MLLALPPVFPGVETAIGFALTLLLFLLHWSLRFLLTSSNSHKLFGIHMLMGSTMLFLTRVFFLIILSFQKMVLKPLSKELFWVLLVLLVTDPIFLLTVLVRLFGVCLLLMILLMDFSLCSKLSQSFFQITTGTVIIGVDCIPAMNQAQSTEHLRPHHPSFPFKDYLFFSAA